MKIKNIKEKTLWDTKLRNQYPFCNKNLALLNKNRFQLLMKNNSW